MGNTIEPSELRGNQRTVFQDLGMVVASEEMRSLMMLVERVATSFASVLITGESGTGKELVARAIHLRSSRKNQPFVDLNCAALPEHLIESELFGYERGAFSGADQAKPGMFELANRGTLFLDEIGEIDPRIQAKLLRVLDGNPYYRLGGKQKITTDVRVISATNRPLDAHNSSGRFRLDLFHRLAQFQLHVPALRERTSDIIPIAEAFLQSVNSDASFSEPARSALLSYSWPGNVRELQNVVLQASTFAESGVIGKNHLPSGVQAAKTGIPSPSFSNPSVPMDLQHLERGAIEQALASTGGHQARAAERLGISRRTLSRRLRQYRMEPDVHSAPLGVISPEQQSCFRAKASFPVKIFSSAGETFATATNLSRRGIGLEDIGNDLLVPDQQVHVEITLPQGVLMEADGQVVWFEQEGKAGVRFTSLNAESQRHLESWVNRKIEEEGWSAKAVFDHRDRSRSAGPVSN